MNCPNCGVEIPENKIKKELRRCSSCDEPIGCVRCRTPGTFAFRFCALHDPRGAFTDDKLFNPHQKEVNGVKRNTSSQKSEIKELIRLLEDECKRYEYGGRCDYGKLEKITKNLANRLIKIGKPAVPELIKLFRDKRRKKKSGILHVAACIIGEIKDERALKPLCDALYREWDIAETAGNALIRFGESAIPSIEKLVYLFGQVSTHAAYVLSSIKSEKSCDLLIRGVEYKLKICDWKGMDDFLCYTAKYNKNFDDRRASNYMRNIDSRLGKWRNLSDGHYDWRRYLPPAKETFYDVIGIRESELSGLSDDKEIRRFLRSKYMYLEKTPEVNLAYDVLKKSDLRKDYDWMLLNHEFIDELFKIKKEKDERKKPEVKDYIEEEEEEEMELDDMIEELVEEFMRTRKRGR